MAHSKTLVVIGGGAAGFFCAVNAARLSSLLKVIIVEKSSKLLSKVKVSGGGRCNVTHACFEVPDLVLRYPRGTNFIKKAFHQFHTVDTIKWFEERGVKLKTEADGRMFPVTDNSQTVIDCLMGEANKYGVEIMMNAEVQRISFKDESFTLELSGSRRLTSDFVCVACGGYPKSSMFDWLALSGHTWEQPVPSLFTFNIPGNAITQLMGISASALVKITGSKLSSEGPLLITHWGMSGPAILKLSAWGARELAERNYHFTILVNWVPPYNEQTLREGWSGIRNQHSTQKVYNRNPFSLPSRLWNHLLNESSVSEHTWWAELTAVQQNKLIKNLSAQLFEVKGKTTFKEEFVTCGGIKLKEVNAGTMESKLVPGLYFAGEVMDVDGITGGFNFQHAWTSGWIAATNIARKVEQ